MTSKTAKKPSKAKPKLKKLETRDEVLETLSGCSLTFSWWGIQKKVGKNEGEKAAAAINANPRKVKTTKEKIDTDMPEWKDLQSLRSAAQGWYNFNTFAYCVRGHRLFRREMREELWRGVAEHAAGIRQAAERLQYRRKDVIEWAKANLGDAFDHKDYPDSFANSFSVQIREHAINPPDYLKTENLQEFHAARTQTMRDVAIAMERFENQCAAKILSAVQKINTTLGEGGNPHASTIELMQTAFGRIAKMKFRGTAAFEVAKKEVEAIMNGVDAKALRRSQTLRDETKAKFAHLLKRHQELLGKVANIEDEEEEN